MQLGIYYITCKNHALRLFPAILDHDLELLEVLYRHDIPLHYQRLHALLKHEYNGVSNKTYTDMLRRCLVNGYITRTPMSGNVVYAITLEGKMFLRNFASELDRLVKQRVMKCGNGFTSL